MKRVCIKNPSGRFAYFRNSPSEAVEAFLSKKVFGSNWRQFEVAGYSVVQVDIRVTKEFKV